MEKETAVIVMIQASSFVATTSHNIRTNYRMRFGPHGPRLQPPRTELLRQKRSFRRNGRGITLALSGPHHADGLQQWLVASQAELGDTLGKKKMVKTAQNSAEPLRICTVGRW